MLTKIIQTTNAKRTGSGYMGHCPAHEDSKASLSISEADGKVLVKCHRGCSQEDVISALKDKDAWELAPLKDNGAVEKYNYTDELGNALYFKTRYPGKHWSIGYYSEEGVKFGGLTESGIRRVLYNLVGIEQARKNNKAVWFVEGEKDANSLIKLGFTATTNDSGAGAGKVKPEQLASLKDMTVVLCGDNDEVGRAHMEALGKALVAYAARIFYIELPSNIEGLPVKDITDYLNQMGHKPEIVGQLKKDAKQLYPIKLVTSYNELLQMELPEPVSWMGGFVAPGEATLVVALPGVGKTWFTFAVAQCLADGHQPLGPWEPKAKLRTLIVDFEMGPMRVRQRLEAIRKGYGLASDVTDRIGILSPELAIRNGMAFSDLGQPDQVKLLMDSVADYDLVILDNVNGAYPSAEEDENSPKFWVQPQALVMALKRLGKASIIVHHSTKGDPRNPAGSGKNVRFFDNVLALVDVTDYEKTDQKKVKFWFRKSRNFPASRDMQPELELQDFQGGTYWTSPSGSFTSEERLHKKEPYDIPW